MCMGAAEEPSADLLRQVSEYKLDNSVGRTYFGDKSFIGVVAVACGGKSTVINELVTNHPDFHAVQTLTTRMPLRRDGNTMRYLPHNAAGFQTLANKMNSQQIAQLTRHPSTGYFYGTELVDYAGKNNIMPVLASSIQQFTKLPFRQSVLVALATKPPVWHERFLDRYPPDDEAATIKAEKRLSEARSSLEWCLSPEQFNLFWLTNHDDAARTAGQLVEIVHQGWLNKPFAHQNSLKLGEKMLASLGNLRQYYTTS